ncbi:hypothetical protein JY651_16495 [Pyxidicoccus parkwayensis]|uniref:Uncharacterized protein n=1 Tax=Pyxidicoccus parkwayensis TaxID=2813578 RepID=A0ABX7P7J6_9BACT|nr:hypothetical protein [Pyxidicoccus parkwaysis]QSQ26426.1 hypothetical protein JY651_16495 [Pyxidicoccus parkwaysis]
MRKLRPSVVALLLAAVAVPGLVLASGLPVHSIWSTKGGAVVIQGTLFAPVLNSSAVSWQEGPGPAFANAKVTVNTTGTPMILELNLVSVNGTPTNDLVQGLWDVTFNGTLVCAACQGYAKGLSHPVGSNYNIDVSNSFYRLDGIITSRFDY